MNAQIKRYLVTDTLITPLPHDFIHSQNEKYIEVVSCKFFVDDNLIAPSSPSEPDIEAIQTLKFISLHADFIQDKRYLDSYVMFCNDYYNQRKKYQQLTKESQFRIWFKEIDGKIIDMVRGDDGFYHQTIDASHKRKIRFVLELLLIY